jgi:hypothetical protein
VKIGGVYVPRARPVRLPKLDGNTGHRDKVVEYEKTEDKWEGAGTRGNFQFYDTKDFFEVNSNYPYELPETKPNEDF